MRATYLALAALLVSSILLLSDHSAAQAVYGQILGRLTSASGTPVSGASINIISVGSGARSGVKSNPEGYFAINNVSADLYQIEVRADNFKKVQATIVVSANSTTTVNVPMLAGDPNTVVASTTAGASVLELNRIDVSTLFDSQAVAELPLLDRNVTRLQLLVPGAARANLGIPQIQNPQGGAPVNFNGQHFSGSAFQVDGTEDRDPLEGIVVINPPLDSVGEMKIATQGYNAEFGLATAGVVTVQTKSGSNAWHGDGFGFRRTGWGQSENPFDPAGVPPSKYNIFGGSFGGPIARNKLFIFGDYQGTRSSNEAKLLLSVPTNQVRNTCVGPNVSGPANCDLSQYSSVIIGSTLKDYEGIPFPNYQIPNKPNNISLDHYVTSQAAALVALLPFPSKNLPTVTDPNCPDQLICDNYLTSGQEVFNADQFDVRTDYIVNSRLRLFGRYSFGQFYDNGAPAFGPGVGGPGTNIDGFAGVARTRNQGISSGFTYTLSPKLLTDFRFGFFRYRLNVNAQDFGQIPNIGIPGIFAGDPSVNNPFATGMPDFEIPGQTGGQKDFLSGGDYLRLGYSNVANVCNCPLREREQQFQFVSNWTLTRGRHIIKWGADLRFLQNYRLSNDRPQTGYFDFAPSTTGLGLATFLIGDVTSGFERNASTPAAVNAGERQKRLGFYGQDTWRINSRLTLNYGLRWEIYFPQTVTGAGGFLVPNLSNHDPGTTYFNTPSTTNSAGGISENFSNLAPRLGFAYLINPTTVVRAGYGRSFDAGYAGDLFGIAATQNPPVAAQQKVQNAFNLVNGPPAFIASPTRFPSSCPLFSLLCVGEANYNSPTGSITQVPSSGAVLFALPARVRVPTVDSWNLTFQHELTSHLYFEVGYVGNKGTKVFADSDLNLGTFYNLNQASLQGLIQPVNGPIIGGHVNKFCKGGKIGGLFGVSPNQYCLLLPSFRSFYVEKTDNGKTFDPNLFSVRYFGNNANNNYNSLQAKVQKSFTRGYSFLAHYTWSKGLDYDSNYFAVDPRVGYGPASFDIRHRFVMTNIWDLPIGRGKAWFGGIGPGADRFVGGWTISAITVWSSGLPFTPSYVRTTCANDTDPGAPCRPNRVAPVHISGSRQQYFTTTVGQPLAAAKNSCSANGNGKFCGVDMNGQPVPGPANGPWQRPGAGQIGNVGRNSFTGPGFFQSDIALAKEVRITERVAFRFRADAFNAFNKVNLGTPNTCVDCGNGGSIRSLSPGATQRRFQFSLEFQF